MDTERKSFTMDEVRDLLGVSEQRVKKLQETGKLDPVYVKKGTGKRRREFSVKSVYRYIQELN